MAVQSTDPNATEFSQFQMELLYTLADQGSLYGLAIKRQLEERYDGTVNHGRLYPNLDDLVQAGLVDKSQRDKRTNEYALSKQGKRLLKRDAQRRHNIASSLTTPGDDTDA